MKHGPVNTHIGFQSFLQTEIRFGNCFVIPANELSFLFYVGFVRRNLSNRIGQVEFALCLDAEFVDDDSGGKVCFPRMEVTRDVSVEQYAALSGLSAEQIESEFKIDELEQKVHAPGDRLREGWMNIARLGYSYSRVPTRPDVLGRVLGENFEFAVGSIDCSYALVKKKCHLL